jgi:hypothetical protein
MSTTITRINSLLFLLLISLTACKKGNDSKPLSPAYANTFGVLPNRTEGGELSIDQKINLAKNQLQVPYVRAGVVIGNYNGRIADVESYQANGLKVLLNINSKVTSSSVPAGPYVSDLAAYRQKLASLLDQYKPAVLVVENEEANGTYYTSPAQDYLNLLEVAIDEAHQRNLPVANGGFTALMTRLLVWDYYHRSGQTAKENSYINRVFPDGTTSSDLQQKISGNSQLAQTFSKAQTLLNAYKNSNLDFVNIHWYEPVKESDVPTAALPDINHVDMSAFEESVNVFKSITGKKIITNEIGQLNIQGGITTAMLQKCYDLQLPFAVWYSGDGDEYGKARALCNSDGTLRPSGIAFSNFITATF